MLCKIDRMVSSIPAMKCDMLLDQDEINGLFI